MLEINQLLWFGPEECSEQEERILKRAQKNRKLYVFLRQHRHEIFDEEFQRELIEMYRQTGAGKEPIAPARLALLTLLQVYNGESDHEAVELTADSKRWQMVLDCLGAEQPLCSQKTLWDFRMRLILTGKDKQLLERTVEVARERGGFGARTLRAALDSSPIWGHGRVEDTINLIAHGVHNVLDCVAGLTEQDVSQVMAAMGLTLFEAKSIKAALDIDWSDSEQKQEALQRLCEEVARLQSWIAQHLAVEREQAPLSLVLSLLDRVMTQDLEPDPGAGVRIRDGVAPDRLISIEDTEMRHGRKSAAKRFDGYKRQILRDLDEELILAAEVVPGNQPDKVALGPLLDEVPAQGRELEALHIDRAYLDDVVVPELDRQGVTIVCKPWTAAQTPGLFTKRDFHIDLEQAQATCPAGQTIAIEVGQTAQFPAPVCDACELRAQCTKARQSGRSLSIHPQEALLQRLMQLPSCAEGRAQLRERVGVEHALAHISQRQGNQARYNGTRKNTFHLRIVCSIQNLERAQRLEARPQLLYHSIPAVEQLAA
jgi:hypothetical protein